MKDYTDMNIFELMEVSTKELKELSVEEFSKEIEGKKVNIHPSSNNGDFVVDAMGANIFIEDGKIKILAFGSCFHIRLSEKTLFGIYSYGNNKNYRIAFEGNSPDLLVTVVGGRLNKRSD